MTLHCAVSSDPHDGDLRQITICMVVPGSAGPGKTRANVFFFFFLINFDFKGRKWLYEQAHSVLILI